MIFVDSSVLIDVIEAKPDWKQWSAEQLTRHVQAGGLAINAIVYAEVARSFPSALVQDHFLKESGIAVLPIPNLAAFMAAQAHRTYRAAGGARSSTLPDFFIGAHALVAQMTLLTRDPVRVRTYFPQLILITP
ncbi:MAG: DNA-binding protein [Comamonadaceae bacterium CG_4_9_14_3_um_filter_60_33]|nr:MAG: DNA-binding protein [Comamonadaceae bacterium CG_4_10_14_3_um_filter_60_42]PJB45761.1 MAG: DNA-binding protein [Comamonadaceae bacterium CG_4_9_14_3_um_filter_60_33]